MSAPALPSALGHDTVLRRFAPFGAAGVLALFTIALPPAPSNLAEPLIAAALTVAIFLSAAFVPFERLPPWTRAVPPLSYLVVILLLRQSQGGAASGYAPLCMLPVFWLALYGTRAQLAVAIAGVAAMFIAPLVIVGMPEYPLSEYRRGILWTGISCLVGFTVQNLVATSRRRALDAEASRAEVAASEENLVTVARLVRGFTTRDDARQAVVEAACEVAGTKMAFLMEPTPENCLEVTRAAGAPIPRVRIRMGEDPSGGAAAFVTRRRFFVADARGHPAVSQRLRELTGAVAVLYEPVMRGATAIGVLAVPWQHSMPAPTDRTVAAVGLLAAEAAVAIDRADLIRRLDQAARTDGLTGLVNRRAWDEELPRALARSRRDGPISVAMLDLDHFKAFNDAHGHQRGDRLLKEAAAAWRESLRESDLVARYGGEEFAVLLPGAPLWEAEHVVQRLRAAMPAGQTCSAGLACWDGEEDGVELLERADAALYRAKAAGRDRVEIAA